MAQGGDTLTHGNSVSIDGKGVIVVVVRGKQTRATVSLMGEKLRAAIKDLTDQGKKVMVFCDARGLKVSDISAEARIEGRKLLSLPVQKSAIWGNGYLGSIVAYIFQFSHNGAHRFFTNERQAHQWLAKAARPPKPRPTVSLVSALVIGAIGLLALWGWLTGNDALTRWIPTLRPINPLAAIGLLAVSYGFISYYFGRLGQLKIVGVMGVILGVAALSPLDIDSILFTQQVLAAGSHANLADSAAFCLIAIGISPFTVGTKKFAVMLFQYALAGIVIGLALFNIFAQLYAPDLIYNINDTFVMAFNLAIAFLLAGITLILIILYRHVGNVLQHITRIGWLIIIALVGIQALTYASWYQATSRNNSDSSKAFTENAEIIEHEIDDRGRAYVDALYGFRGLFAASEAVDQGEFQTYFESLHLERNYPGLRALSFIAKVDENNLQNFVRSRQNDKSLHKGGNPTFAILNKANTQTHYVLTYNASSPTAVGGGDLAGTPARVAAFQKADATGSPVASDTLEFAGVDGQPPEKGFFLTIPVSNKGSSNTIGYVNAVFNYKDFFVNSLAESNLDNLNVTVNSAKTNENLYIKHATDDKAYTHSLPIAMADQTWHIDVSAGTNYGVSRNQRSLPGLLLTGGQFFSAFLLTIFIMQSRARKQALNLADSITEDLHYERNIAVANDRKSNAILTSIGDAVFAVNNKGHVTLFNPAAEHISGYAANEALGKPYDKILRFISEESGRPHFGFIKQALAGHVSSMKNHTMLIRKDGTKVAVADSAAPIRDSKGAIQGAIIVFRDVSKEQALDKAKTEFVSLASHQLRTPLSAINWFSEMLLHEDAGKLNKDQHEYLREIYEGNQRMIELVDSLLNVSRLEVGKLRNDPKPTSMQELAESLHKELQTSILNKGIDYTSHIPAKLPTVFADPKLLRMVVQNLLSNAVKYTTEKGKVTLVMREASPADIADKLNPGHYLYIGVTDNGYGIPVAQQDKIFQKLFRADNVRKLDVEGTGLGLYIVKEVAEKFGGAIWFESEEGKGTTFHVLIPFKTEAT